MSERLDRVPAKDIFWARAGEIASKACRGIPPLGHWYLGDDVERSVWRASGQHVNRIDGWQKAERDSDAGWLRANWPNTAVLTARVEDLRQVKEGLASISRGYSVESAAAFAVKQTLLNTGIPDQGPPPPEQPPLYYGWYGTGGELAVALRLGPDEDLRASLGAHRLSDGLYVGSSRVSVTAPVPVAELGAEFPGVVKL